MAEIVGAEDPEHSALERGEQAGVGGLWGSVQYLGRYLKEPDVQGTWQQKASIIGLSALITVGVMCGVQVENSQIPPTAPAQPVQNGD